MELRNFLQRLWRWAWLLVLGALVGLAAGYGLSRLQTPEYEAATTILLVRPAQDSLSELGYLNDQQLAQTYGQLLLTRPILAAAEAQLGAAIDVNRIDLEFVADTQLIRLTVRDADPQRAAAIANTLVLAFTAQNESLQGGQYTDAEAALQEQITQVEQQITDLQTQIATAATTSLNTQRQHLQDQMAAVQAQLTTLQAELVTLTDQYDLTVAPVVVAATPAPAARPTPTTPQRIAIETLQAQLAQQQNLLALYQEAFVALDVQGDSSAAASAAPSELQSALTLYQQIHAGLLSDYANIRLTRLRGTPGLTQVEPAEAPTEPVTPAPLLLTLVGGLGGLALAATALFLLEYLSDALDTPEEIEAAFHLPVLGRVPPLRAAALHTPLAPGAPPTGGAEAFHALRTNLEFAHGAGPHTSLLVTSPGTGEGKTTVALNLALAWVQAGRRVLLLDADLRKPQLHRLLQLPNARGLADLLRGTCQPGEALQPTPLPGLTVLTAGSDPADLSEVLSPETLARVLAEVSPGLDIVVVDGPPAFMADALVLAAAVDHVLVTVQPGRAHRAAARTISEQLQRAGARLVGLTLNRVDDHRGYYGGGYGALPPKRARSNGRVAANKQSA